MVSKTELCLFTFGIGWGAEASLSARPNQTRCTRGSGSILADRPALPIPIRPVPWARMQDQDGRIPWARMQDQDRCIPWARMH